MVHANRTIGAELGGVAVEGSGAGLRGRLARHALLPLRLFLGATFLYAGIDKLLDHAFLAASGAGSIGETLRQVHDAAALPQLVDLAQQSPVGFGYAIAAGELAVGLGTLVGLLGRLAALGGALISLSLWLTVSWATTPYYYGNDLAYLMAWVPLVLAGTPRFSLDSAWAHRRKRHGTQLFG
ncbi:thiosulfate dehydrogenase [quinone] large subunit [Streptomyces sp. 2224.1]|uniref:TQO small subunit DoxD n=1 Tax=unclassified Streptomyces TaxID=2593676 RepID=UPI000880B737|nr:MULTISPECIES: TQO small subunit DoxD [unclassified Streptomyces]PBC84482.1 thiosulfate dehydrogenase [quinone] large subunit [Streptomyces sp. 2321.6]SDR30177.1 thiosulfate dehydrogenase [quinone] large subunit [Streptomyces sp. KS_16]SEB70042.1 thiosulfate dehydrogenase [quinone] large subunit [Streptomyces sp. 2224.1]SED32980.1 thiosulfate dehydrogenase [quinone] large subunit [Streptomyces sp. 2133.1]SEE50934.1 thiosulfate dehydrogenase [quinone] large subunit [Streptomyces sp. 2112.3]